MSNNLNDPREDVLRTDSGVGRYLEEDKRDEKMYIYDAKVLDLCDLPISEYMKSGWNNQGNNETKIETELPENGMLPNILYNLGEIQDYTVFTFSDDVDETIVNHYYFTFSTNDSTPTIEWPSQITKWVGGEAPTINENKYYEISVLNGIACYIEA